jgi:hypothetical protein
MSRSKIIEFVIEIPVTSLEKSKGLFSSQKVGDLQVCGKGRILGEPIDSPYALMKEPERKWIDITISGIYWKLQTTGVGMYESDITLLLRHMKEAREINRAILEASADYCRVVYEENYSKQ